MRVTKPIYKKIIVKIVKGDTGEMIGYHHQIIIDWNEMLQKRKKKVTPEELE